MSKRKKILIGFSVFVCLISIWRIYARLNAVPGDPQDGSAGAAVWLKEKMEKQEK